MKKIALFGLVALTTGLVFAEAGNLRYSVMVNKFENKANWTGRWNLGDAWGTVFTDQLVQSGKFIVLGEADMRGAAIAEQDFAASGRAAGGKKAPKMGRMTPAQLLVKGAITHVQETKGAGGGFGFKGITPPTPRSTSRFISSIPRRVRSRPRRAWSARAARRVFVSVITATPSVV